MPSFYFTNVTPSTEAVLSVAEAKKHCDIPQGEASHDLELAELVTAAVEDFQRLTRAQLLPSTDDLTFDCFPSGPIYIPRWPVTSITSIKYQDVDDAEQTWSSAEYIFAPIIPARISFAKDITTYPTIAERAGAVTIRLVTGYTNAASVPDNIKLIIKNHVKQAFDQDATEKQQMALFRQIRSHRQDDYWEYP